MTINGHRPAGKPVRITMERDEQKVLYVVVRVRSKLKPTSVFIGKLDSREFQSQADVRKRVETMAGALAERIAERHGDTYIDPSECARLAVEEWEELLKRPESEVIPR